MASLLPLRHRASSSRALSHLRAHLQQRWSFATHAAAGAQRGSLLGLQGMQQFHMEKLSGWEQATHQLAASDCEPLSLSELRRIPGGMQRPGDCGETETFKV